MSFLITFLSHIINIKDFNYFFLNNHVCLLLLSKTAGYQILLLETPKTLMSKIQIEKRYFQVTYDIC